MVSSAIIEGGQTNKLQHAIYYFIYLQNVVVVVVVVGHILKIV